MASKNKLELAFQEYLKERTAGNSIFDLNPNELNNTPELTKMPIFHGQSGETFTRPCLTISSVEASELAINSGIRESKIDLQLESQSGDTTDNEHSDRSAVLEAIISDNQGAVTAINSKQKYVFISGFYLETHQSLREDKIWLDIFRLSVVYMDIG